MGRNDSTAHWDQINTFGFAAFANSSAPDLPTAVGVHPSHRAAAAYRLAPSISTLYTTPTRSTPLPTTKASQSWPRSSFYTEPEFAGQLAIPKDCATVACVRSRPAGLRRPEPVP